MYLNRVVVICAWCKETIGTKDYVSEKRKNKLISHGICVKCAKKLQASM